MAVAISTTAVAAKMAIFEVGRAFRAAWIADLGEARATRAPPAGRRSLATGCWVAAEVGLAEEGARAAARMEALKRALGM